MSIRKEIICLPATEDFSGFRANFDIIGLAVNKL